MKRSRPAPRAACPRRLRPGAIAGAVTVALALLLAACPSASLQQRVSTIEPPGGGHVSEAEWAEALSRFEVIAFEVGIDATPPRIEETDRNVVIEAPAFRAAAKVRCDAAVADGWAVGFVQAVTSMVTVNTYPAATTSWELGIYPVNDSDGTYPWYSPGARVIGCSGDARVALSDPVRTSVSWLEPRPHTARRDPPRGTLQRYHRDQSFTLWLVALHVPTDRVVVLREVDWRIALELDFDTQRPVGERSRVLAVERAPIEVRAGDPARPVPLLALRPPRANEDQEFWWNPDSPELGVRTRLQAPTWGPR